MEKRRERRLSVDLGVTIIYQDSQIPGRVTNLSRLGAYAQIDREIPPGKDVDLALKLDDCAGSNPSLSGTIKCKARIFRCSQIEGAGPRQYYGLGLFFTHFLSEADKEELSHYLDFVKQKEAEAIQRGIKRWKKKKKINQNKKQPDNHTDTAKLLEQVLKRLKEISRQLQTQKRNETF